MASPASRGLAKRDRHANSELVSLAGNRPRMHYPKANPPPFYHTIHVSTCLPNAVSWLSDRNTIGVESYEKSSRQN